MGKINCKKDCRYTCCDDVGLELRKDIAGINPNYLPVGAWLYVAGIIWKKKKNGLWRCLCFNVKTRLCKIYLQRPPLCRSFLCPHGRKKRVGKLPANYKASTADAVYEIVLKKYGKESKDEGA